MQKRDALDTLVKQSERNKFNEFNDDMKQFINRFEADNKGQWVNHAMRSIDSKLKKIEDILM